ncbi:MAG: TetR/AcrR family transcriptional regulator [Pelagimonas sp.]|jgi:AcrR family transcriptional regulator|nr:TetR/AcrR family transcriptional regulator [Pelagimonas sp.]
MSKTRLSQEDWIKAGFRALTKGGHAALRAEAIARDLKTTKGSFYWHFKGLTDYKTALLKFWADQATAGIITGLAPLAPGLARLTALIEIASQTPEEFGGPQAEPAIREWARYDTEAADAVRRIDQERITYLRAELAQLGVHTPEAADLFYAAHLGLEQLAISTQDNGQQARLYLLELLATASP